MRSDGERRQEENTHRKSHPEALRQEVLIVVVRLC